MPSGETSTRTGSRHARAAAGAFAILRPHQWIKNGFVLIGFLFAHEWGNTDVLRSVLALLAAFCAVASAVYIYNDIHDVEADRQHPRKRSRPIASGALPLPMAWSLCIGLAALGGLLALFASVVGAALVAAYVGMNIAYTHWLKYIVILDIFIISTGFMLRILAGTLGVGIEPSHWLLLCGFMITLFLGFAKRRAELTTAHSATGTSSRAVLAHYRADVLDQFLAVTAACSVLSYSLYTVSPETAATHGTKALIFTVPFIVYGMFRYMLILHDEGRGQDTAGDLLTDGHLLVSVFGWVTLTAWLLA